MGRVPILFVVLVVQFMIAGLWEIARGPLAND